MADLTRRLAGALLVTALAGSMPAAAQGWPEKAIRLVVPFPPGGATDIIGRVIAQQVSKGIGQPVVVDNKPGAGGTIGATDIIKDAADGYTLLMTTSSTHAIAPHLMPALKYDVAKDFTPIIHVADAASVLVVSPSLPVASARELIDHARRNPTLLNYASSGNGTIVHLTTEAFRSQADITMTHVPYKGTALSVPDVAAGTVHVLFDSIPSAIPHVRSGRLKALAVTGAKRSALWPELPTIAESALPGFSSVTWFGVFAPRSMAPDLVLRIHGAFDKALRTPDVQDALARQGAEAAPPRSPQGFADLVAEDSRRWGALIRERKITVE